MFASYCWRMNITALLFEAKRKIREILNCQSNNSRVSAKLLAVSTTGPHFSPWYEAVNQNLSAEILAAQKIYTQFMPMNAVFFGAKADDENFFKKTPTKITIFYGTANVPIIFFFCLSLTWVRFQVFLWLSGCKVNANVPFLMNQKD